MHCLKRAKTILLVALQDLVLLTSCLCHLTPCFCHQIIRLDAAKNADYMNIPGWKLHGLTGKLAGHFSVTVNGNWRLTFTFEDGDAVLVDYQDYH